MVKYMQKNRIVLFGLALLIGLGSCTSESGGIASSMGKPTDVIISSDQETLSDLAPLITEVYEKEQPYFVFGGEPYFNSINMNFKGMKGSMLRQKTITMLIHDENKKYIKEEYGLDVDDLQLKMKDKHSIVLKDIWAAPQHVIVIYGETKADLAAYLKENAETVRSTTLHAETKDVYKNFLTNSTAISHYEKIKKVYGCGVAIPNTFVLRHQKDGFFWFMEDTENYTSSITVFAYPYTDTAQFNTDAIIKMRDSMAKAHVKGEMDGTYMSTTSKDKYLRFSKVKNYNGNYTKEVRGKWSVKGEFKAGPFISYSILHEPTNQIFVVEGFLMYPDTDKKKTPFLRIYESLPWSFK